MRGWGREDQRGCMRERVCEKEYKRESAFRILASSLSDNCLFVQIVFTSTMYLNGMFSLYNVAAKIKHTLDTKRQFLTHQNLTTQNCQIIPMPKYLIYGNRIGLAFV